MLPRLGRDATRHKLHQALPSLADCSGHQLGEVGVGLGMTSPIGEIRDLTYQLEDDEQDIVDNEGPFSPVSIGSNSKEDGSDRWWGKSNVSREQSSTSRFCHVSRDDAYIGT